MPLRNLLPAIFRRTTKYVPTVEIEFIDPERTHFRINKVWDRAGNLHELQLRPEHKWGSGEEGRNVIAEAVASILGEAKETVTFHINEP